MVREATNQYDPCAIALYYKDVKIGFIPRACNEKLADFLDLGYNSIFSVTINRVSPQETPERQIGIIVRLLANSYEKPTTSQHRYYRRSRV